MVAPTLCLGWQVPDPTRRAHFVAYHGSPKWSAATWACGRLAGFAPGSVLSRKFLFPHAELDSTIVHPGNTVAAHVALVVRQVMAGQLDVADTE